MPLGVSQSLTTTLASSRTIYLSNPGISENYVCGRSHIRHCNTVVAKVKCNVASPGDTGSSSEMKLLHTNNCTGISQAAVCNSSLIIREAYLTDFWEVSDTHCGAFFPHVKFPMDFILRSDRAMTMLGNLTLPSDQKRICLVALEALYLDSVETESKGENSKPQFSFLVNLAGAGELSSKVSGALTMDTLAEFLPRRKPLSRRRTGIAYVSNVAVRPSRRRRGIAGRLIKEAQRIARTWGCRSMALHVDVNNAAAEALYLRQGFRRVKIPAGAKWPQPQALPGANLQLMMKHLGC
ncbi:hypothetical protein MPTK2_1g15020 [Marchantia polymorpha subsp. ruderalis]